MVDKDKKVVDLTYKIVELSTELNKVRQELQNLLDDYGHSLEKKEVKNDKAV